jgi:two-component system CheB/CheR fusion protein
VALAGARILAVDDDEDSLLTFAMLLQYEGAVVDTACDSKAALALLAEKTYDVLISDLSMPGMDGFELMAAARKLPTRQRLLAIAVTGYGRDADVRNALKAGFDAHVAKPVSIAQLQAALDAL